MDIKIFIQGGKYDYETTRLFLPIDLIDYTERIEKVDHTLIQRLGSELSTSRVAFIKAGLGVESDFAVELRAARINPGQIIVFPKRVANSNLEDGFFPLYTKSPFETREPSDPHEALNRDCVMSHGVTLSYILKNNWDDMVEIARAKGFETVINTNAFIYQIDSGIASFMRNLRDSVEEVKNITADIKDIMSGKYVEKSLPDAIIDQVKQKQDFQKEQPDPLPKQEKEIYLGQVRQTAEKSANKREQLQKIRDFKRKKAQSKLKSMTDLPDDIAHRLKSSS